MKERIIKDAKHKHAWVTREQGIELENLIVGGGSEVGKELVEKIDQVDEELQEYKGKFDSLEEEFNTLNTDHSHLGEQVSHLASEISGLVRKDIPTIKELCNNDCAWAGDLQSQISSIGRELDAINKKIGNGRVEDSDLLFATTKEITITLSNAQMVGSFYWYDFEYDITNWDDATYNLEGLIFKNLHKDNGGGHGQVDKNTKKMLVTLTFDETNLYGTIQSANMLNGSSNEYQMEVTCLWKKVLS